MQKANLIIRGFLFKKDRVQGCDSENWWKYDINFLNLMPTDWAKVVEIAKIAREFND